MTKKVFLKLLVPVIVTILLTFVFYHRINQLLDVTSKVIPKMEYCLHTADKNDMIILGSSRAYYHFNPRIIDSICGIESYNLGIDGSAIVEQNMLLRTYLQCHAAPKMVLLNVDFLDFDSKMVVYNSLDYMPYLKDPEVKTAIGGYAHYKYAFLAPFLRLQRDCSVPDDKVKCYALFASDDALINVFKNESEDKYYGEAYRGYQANNAPLEGDANDPVSVVPVKYDATALNILSGMLQLCKEREITPVLVYSPLYRTYSRKFSGYQPLMDTVAAIAKQNNALYLDYSKVAYMKDSSCFYNITHLNGKGSSIFSAQLAIDLKKNINWN